MVQRELKVAFGLLQDPKQGGSTNKKKDDSRRGTKGRRAPMYGSEKIVEGGGATISPPESMKKIWKEPSRGKRGSEHGGQGDDALARVCWPKR